MRSSGAALSARVLVAVSLAGNLRVAPIGTDYKAYRRPLMNLGLRIMPHLSGADATDNKDLTVRH